LKQLTVSGGDSGSRLDRYLMKYLSGAPSGLLYRQMRKKNITLNRKKCTGSERLREGDTVEIFFSDETIAKFSVVPGQVARASAERKNAGEKLSVIYSDSDLMFVDKPAGILSQGDDSGEQSMVGLLLRYVLDSRLMTEEQMKTSRPSVCSRLDRNTSGILLCGLTRRGSAFLSEQLRTRDLKKYYLCLAEGIVERPVHLSGWLVKDRDGNKASVYRTEEEIPAALRREAREIRTDYRPAAHGENATLLAVHLVTGRSHQIRAHLASEGHPLLGDPKYGRTGGRKDAAAGPRRQMLHAWKIVFPEIPGDFSYLSGKSFEAPLPADFLRAARQAGIRIPEKIDVLP
jgi:23S rRNA pseudouridine955/2504/2580 synthase